MVAGIFEKSKRLRKALFFIVKRLPISRAAGGRAKPRYVGRVFIYGRPLIEDRAAVPTLVEPKEPEPSSKPGKTAGRLRGQSFPQAPLRRFSISSFEFFAPVLRPVSAPPARGAAAKTSSVALTPG